MRQFATGAIRDTDEGKVDYEGCLSPIVLRRFAEYMLLHCTQADGNKRTCDNWQKGFGFDSWMKSLLRHTFDLWTYHRSNRSDEITDALKEELACAVIFNIQGYLHELLKEKANAESTETTDA